MASSVSGRIRRASAIALIAVAAVAGVVPAAHATSPGHNGGIAFAMDLGDGAQIYTIQPDGSALTQLTSVDGSVGSPDWSPDGTRIAFGVEDAGLYVMDADGGGLHEVAASGGQPAFTPDGHHL